MTPRIGVLGAGSWGTTLADLLARKGIPVRIWAFEPAVVESINARHENELFLAGSPLAPSLAATGEVAEAVSAADLVLLAAPSHAARAVLTAARASIRPGTILACASKGLEADTLELMSAVAAAALPGHPFVALSGPSFASEVYAGQPTAVVAASADRNAALEVQGVFSTAQFRVYWNDDVVGTELGGALKNVIAIAAGILEGLGLGHNPRAALITRGLAEMTRLGEALGARPATFAGLAGIGDLILTAAGPQSRNRALGEALARGVALEQYRREHRTVAEGVNTARAAVALAARHQVEMPITTNVAGILFDGKAPRQAIAELMERTPKPEQWT